MAIDKIFYNYGENEELTPIDADSLNTFIDESNAQETDIEKTETTIADIKTNIAALKVNNLLWEGAYFMNAGQTITLADSILNQPTGAVLIFSSYDSENKVGSDTEFTCHFVPKKVVSLHDGYGHGFNLCNAFSNGTKYLYIGQTTIRGHANNEGNHTVGGISYTNSNFVLRYVIGV